MTIYNFDGDAAEFIWYWDEGDVASHHIYSYGDLGCINRTVGIDKDGKQTVENRSDQECIDGRVRANSFSENRTWTAPDNSKHTYKFDQYGNEIEKQVENVNGTSSSESTTSTFDSRGLLITQYYRQSGGYEKLSKFNYEFDTFDELMNCGQSAFFD